jgi:excisionase family DNA binding protein
LRQERDDTIRAAHEAGLTVREIARLAGVSHQRVHQVISVRPSSIYEAVRTGRVVHLKIGRHVRFLRSDLEQWVLSLRRH